MLAGSSATPCWKVEGSEAAWPYSIVQLFQVKAKHLLRPAVICHGPECLPPNIFPVSNRAIGGRSPGLHSTKHLQCSSMPQIRAVFEATKHVNTAVTVIDNHKKSLIFVLYLNALNIFKVCLTCGTSIDPAAGWPSGTWMLGKDVLLQSWTCSPHIRSPYTPISTAGRDTSLVRQICTLQCRPRIREKMCMPTYH